MKNILAGLLSVCCLTTALAQAEVSRSFQGTIFLADSIEGTWVSANSQWFRPGAETANSAYAIVTINGTDVRYKATELVPDPSGGQYVSIGRQIEGRVRCSVNQAYGFGPGSTNIILACQHKSGANAGHISFTETSEIQFFLQIEDGTQIGGGILKKIK